jgi:hypothetical protein
MATSENFEQKYFVKWLFENSFFVIHVKKPRINMLMQLMLGDQKGSHTCAKKML